MREQKKQTVRWVRNKDGSLRPVSADKVDQLKDMWGKQSATLEITPPSFKDDFKGMINGIKTKKAKQKVGSNQASPSQSRESQNKTHTIAITVPTFKLPEFLRPRNIPKKYLISAAVVVAAIGIIWLVWPSGSSSPVSEDQQGEVAGQIQFKVNPEYAVMSPAGAGVESLGGYALISPVGEPKVYAYTDKIGDVPIKVSQQELPDSIGQDALKLRDLASQFNATEQIQVDDRSAYVGISVDGPQSVIFARENILVLIASDAEIPNKQWVEYLGELRF